MRPRTYKTRAIVIKRNNLGEADKILTLLTPYYGKLRVLAKGIRWLKSRKAPSLELFSSVIVFVAKGKNLDIVTEVRLTNGYRQLRQDLERVRYAYQFSEMINQMIKENQAQEEVFELLEKALNWLDQTPKVQGEGLRRFQLALLDQLGFGHPAKKDIESLESFIESIIDRKLVAGKNLDLR